MIMKPQKYLLAALSFSLTLVSPAQVVTTINTFADAYIDFGGPAENYGTLPELFVRAEGPDPLGPNNEKTYMKFDVSSLLGSGENFSTSSLSMTMSRPGNASTTAALTIHGIVDNLDSWTEGDITWNNAPKNDTTSRSALLGNTVVLGTATIPAGTPQETVITFSDTGLTDYLNWTAGVIADPYGNGASADTITTIIVTGSNGALGAFYSKEGSGTRLPQLTVTAVPEPGTYALVAGFVTFGLILLRRHRKGDQI